MSTTCAIPETSTDRFYILLLVQCPNPNTIQSEYNSIAEIVLLLLTALEEVILYHVATFVSTYRKEKIVLKPTEAMILYLVVEP